VDANFSWFHHYQAGRVNFSFKIRNNKFILKIRLHYSYIVERFFTRLFVEKRYKYVGNSNPEITTAINFRSSPPVNAEPEQDSRPLGSRRSHGRHERAEQGRHGRGSDPASVLRSSLQTTHLRSEVAGGLVKTEVSWTSG